MNSIYLEPDLIKRDGPFNEFKQDVSIVSVELNSGKQFHQILLMYPNEIIGMNGVSSLPFSITEVSKVFQTKDDLSKRADMTWIFNWLLFESKASLVGGGIQHKELIGVKIK